MRGPPFPAAPFTGPHPRCNEHRIPGAHTPGSPLGLKYNTPALSSWGAQAAPRGHNSIQTGTGFKHRKKTAELYKSMKPKKPFYSLTAVTSLYQPSAYSEKDMEGKTEVAGLTHGCGLFQKEASRTPACGSESCSFLPCSCPLIVFPSTQQQATT